MSLNKTKKVLKWCLFFLTAVVVALSIFMYGLLTVVSKGKQADAQVVGDVIWYDAPDGGVGFKIIESDHPNYRIKVTMNSPDELYYEGLFIYEGSALDEVVLTDLGSYLGLEIALMNGETMTPVE